MIRETKITLADVGENLMPDSVQDDQEKYLANLIQALEKAKDARLSGEIPFKLDSSLELDSSS